MRSCSRIVTLLLTACLLLGSFCALPALAANGPVTVDAHNGGSMGPKQITSDYCIRVNLGAPFTKLTAVMPTWGQADAEASLALYKWDVDYNTTLASEPIAYKLFSPLVDCATNELTFDAQPAGEYLFRIADIKGTVGVMQKDMTVSQGYCYESGKESRADWWMTVTFTEKPETPFHEVSSMLDGIDGKHTSPEEWVPAEDHLLNTHKVMPDTWVFTDGLGRVSLTNAEVGDPKDKTVAMFYWTWHGGGSATPLNLTEFMLKYPEAKNDYNHSAWPDGVAYFWNEPVFGYYKTTDEWVLRKHAELLANAGVDTIFHRQHQRRLYLEGELRRPLPHLGEGPERGRGGCPQGLLHPPLLPLQRELRPDRQPLHGYLPPGEVPQPLVLLGGQAPAHGL